MAETQSLEHEERMLFDAAERYKIQDALWRYMQDNGVGVPALRTEIIKADKPRHRDIPISTLQRFVGGSPATQHHHVRLCYEFASKLPHYGEDFEVAITGRALFAFLNGIPDKDDLASVVDLTGDFAGAYETRTKPVTQGGPFPFPPESDATTSQISFESIRGRPYLRAYEFEPDLINQEHAPERRVPFDGVLIFSEPLIYVFLRNTLTRQPKTYTLGKVFKVRAGQDIVLLEGECFDTWFLRDRPAQRLSDNFRVQFVPRDVAEVSP